MATATMDMYVARRSHERNAVCRVACQISGFVDLLGLGIEVECGIATYCVLRRNGRGRRSRCCRRGEDLVEAARRRHGDRRCFVLHIVSAWSCSL
jgi:hypothetical protein